jgi:hypothetical protein
MPKQQKQKYVKAPRCAACRDILLDMGTLPDELRIGICPYCQIVYICEPIFVGETFNRWKLWNFDALMLALEHAPAILRDSLLIRCDIN